MFIPVIMAGGSGSRLWPLSRSAFPKQFLSLDSSSQHTMLQATIERLQGLPIAEPIVISNEDHRFIVAEQIRRYGKVSHYLRTSRKEHCTCDRLSSIYGNRTGGWPRIASIGCRSFCKNKSAFQAAISQAAQQAEAGKLATFGIVPTTPETGYGYIHRGEEVTQGTYEINSFVEKPQLNIAEQYLASGEYYWNSGCFMFKASVFLNELKQHSPEIYRQCELAMQGLSHDYDFIRVGVEEFLKCPDDSIDYAVMEHTKLGVVVSMDAGWSDVGSWSALWEVSDKDADGNVCQGDAILSGTSNCYIYAPNKLVAAVGLKDIVVVETKDAVLVADKTKYKKSRR